MENPPCRRWPCSRKCSRVKIYIKVKAWMGISNSKIMRIVLFHKRVCSTKIMLIVFFHERRVWSTVNLYLKNRPYGFFLLWSVEKTEEKAQSSETIHCRQLEAASLKYCKPHLFRSLRLPDIERHRNASLSTYYSRSGPYGLWPVSRVKTALNIHRHWTVEEFKAALSSCLRTFHKMNLRVPSKLGSLVGKSPPTPDCLILNDINCL